MQTWFLIVISIVCWGAWAVAEKISLKYMSPLMVIIVGMYVYSSIAPLLFLYMKSKGMPTDWDLRGIVWAIITTLLSTVAGLSFIHLIQRAHVHTAVGFTSIYPILTFVLCAIFLGEPVTVLKLFGIITIVAGTMMLSM